MVERDRKFSMARFLPATNISKAPSPPGWWVERKERPPIPVVTHKEVVALILKAAAVLEENELKRIRLDIEHRCRDVVV